MNKTRISILLFVSLLSACSDYVQLIRQDATTPTKLDPADTICVSIPEDVQATDTHRNPGPIVAQIVSDAFSKHSRSVHIAGRPETVADALGTARANSCKLLAYLTILDWEDRVTEWSGLPDQVSVKVEVIEVATSRAMTSAIAKGRGRTKTLSPRHPQDMLPAPIQQYVSSLY